MPQDDRSIVGKTGAPSAAVAEFLAKAQAMTKARADSGRERLIFALDATMSRQPTWDLACRLQAEMFAEAGRVGGLEVQLVYFRGFAECRASRWACDAAGLGELMSRIRCQGGQTQILRVLEHAANETRRRPVRGVVFVGDAMEEAPDALCAKAGELALLGVPVFLFQEGADLRAETTFREMARLSRGAWCRFDQGAAHQLGALLRAVAAYAAGGRKALAALADQGEPAARQLIAQIGPR
jgi:hypothetical protein